MKLIALCGAAGAGKDTVADMLPARKLAFADTLYAEVAGAWGVTVEWLRMREIKENPQYRLSIGDCDDEGFMAWKPEELWSAPNTSREILHRWGDYRRGQDPDYFVIRAKANLIWAFPQIDVVITDVRFPNEAAMVRQLGGQIWQIRRPGYEAGGTGHVSDTAGDEFSPDRVIVNGGSLEDLRATVLAAWHAS